MATGGNSGDLERLEDKVEATRTDLASIAGAVNGLTELVTDLVRRSSIDHQDDRWQARLSDELAAARAAIPDVANMGERVAYLLDQQASTLVDLQSAQPQTAERLDRIAAAVADLRSTPPPPPEIDIDLEPLSVRIDALHDELRDVRAGQPSTDLFVERVAELVDGQSSALTKLQSAQPQLAARLDQLVAGLADVAARPTESSETIVRLERLSTELAELRATESWLNPALGPITGRVDALAATIDRLGQQPDVRPAIEQLAAAVESVRADVAQNRSELAALLASRIAALTDIAERLHTSPPDISVRLDQIQAELADVRARTPDVPGSIAPVLEGLAQVAADISGLQPLTTGLETVTAEVATLRERQLDPTVINSFLADRLDRVTAEIVALRAELPDPPASADAVTSVSEGIEARLGQLSGSVAPLVDRLAIVVDALSAMHSDVAALADSISALRADRSQLVQMTMETNGRLDLLASTLAELRSSVPDYGRHFVETNERIERVAATLADAIERGGAETGIEPPPDYAPSFVDLTVRIERLGAGVAAIAGVVAEATKPGPPPEPAPDYLTNFDDLASRVDRVAAAVAEVHTSRPDLTSSFVALTGLLETVQTGVTGVHDRIDSLDELVQQAGTPPDTAPSIDAITALHTRIDALASHTESAQQRIAAVLQDLPILVTRLDEERAAAMGRQLTELRGAVIDALPEPVPDTSKPGLDELTSQVATLTSDVKSAIRATVGLGADITDLRTHLTDIAANLAERDTTEPVRALSASLRDLRTELQTTRAEVNKIGDALDDLEVELTQPAQDEDFEAGAALVASAAAAMTRLEGRIDGEFDAVGRHMEALGTLLGQVIDALHRVEEQVVGPHPVAARMRTAADTVLESLRDNVRQRANRHGGAPHELGRGAS